jgi:TonB family protein
MNRTEKKCLVFSAGMHGLLAVILIGSAAFRSSPAEDNAPILSLIPANIIDGATTGGQQSAPMVRVTQPAAQSQPAAPAQPQSQPQRQPPPQPQPVAREQVQTEAEPAVVRHPQRQKVEEQDEPRPVAVSDEPAPRRIKPHRQHEIHPTFTPTEGTLAHKSSRTITQETSGRSEEQRLKAIENSLDSSLGNLASSVRVSGAGKTIVDVPGVGGGGEVSAGYSAVVKSIYNQRWIAPETGSSRSALPEARIVISRDGTVISAELISPSGETTLDKSIIRVLNAVTHLPPFPASMHEDQISFRMRFSLELKESSG